MELGVDKILLRKMPKVDSSSMGRVEWKSKISLLRNIITCTSTVLVPYHVLYTTILKNPKLMYMRTHEHGFKTRLSHGKSLLSGVQPPARSVLVLRGVDRLFAEFVSLGPSSVLAL